MSGPDNKIPSLDSLMASESPQAAEIAPSLDELMGAAASNTETAQQSSSDDALSQLEALVAQAAEPLAESEMAEAMAAEGLGAGRRSSSEMRFDAVFAGGDNPFDASDENTEEGAQGVSVSVPGIAGLSGEAASTREVFYPANPLVSGPAQTALKAEKENTILQDELGSAQEDTSLSDQIAAAAEVQIGDEQHNANLLKRQSETEVADLKGKLGTVTNEVARLLARKEELNNTVLGLQKDQKSLSQERDSLTLELDKQTSGAKAVEQAKRVLDGKVADLYQKLVGAQALVAEHERKIKSFENDKKVQKTKLEAMQSELERLRQVELDSSGQVGKFKDIVEANDLLVFENKKYKALTVLAESYSTLQTEVMHLHSGILKAHPELSADAHTELLKMEVITDAWLDAIHTRIQSVRERIINLDKDADASFLGAVTIDMMKKTSLKVVVKGGDTAEYDFKALNALQKEIEEIMVKHSVSKAAMTS